MLASIFSLNVIQTALELGCIYAIVALALFLSYSILNIADLSTDGWEECFQYDTWLKVFEDMGIDPKFYCQRPIGLDEVTPWSHMDYGVTHEYLVREYNKALAAQTTQPCNRACHGCGANHLLGGPCFDYSQDLV